MTTNVHGLAESLGITRLATLTGLDRIGFPVVAAIRPLSRNLTVSMGKGPTLEQAQLSAVMESAELHFSERPHVPIARGSFHDLAPDEALDPLTLETNTPAGDLRNVPLDWLQGRNVQTGETIMVPWQAITMDCSVDRQNAGPLVSMGGTGLAAAFDPLSAALHGLYEVIERDRHLAWNGLDNVTRLQTLIDPSSVANVDVQTMLAKVENADLRIWIWDMTGNGRVPTYLVEILDYAPDATTPFAQGAAAHLHPGTAIAKAMSEALQVRLTYISGSRDDLEWSDYGDRYDAVVKSRRWLAQMPLTYHRHLENRDVPELDPRAALRKLCHQLGNDAGSDAIAVQLTPETHPVSVVKVIVPQLRDTPDANHYENLRRLNRAH